ncbi:MAG: peptidylprolyl isomerase [Coprococcus sp.]
MAEKEKKPNNTAAENENPKPEKKMTKYDLKMQRRREQELKEQKMKKISRTVGILVVIVCVCAVIWRVYDNYQEKHGPYISIDNHDIKKAEFDYYYYNSVNSFASTYGSYASIFGLDLSQPLDEQSYSDTMTWEDYFEQQAVEQMKMVYALTDEASENGFTYDAEEDYNAMVDSITANAASQDMSADDYCQAIFGSDATLENIKPYVLLSSTASAYYDSIEDATEITEDEISTYYEENKDSYDSVDYRICKIAADMPEEETEAETEAAAESGDETEETAETMSEEEKEAAEAEQKAAEEAAMAEAKAKADDMLSKVTDEDSFVKAYKDYAEDETVDSLNTNKKKSSITPSDVAEWLFDEVRQAGDKTVIEYESGDAYYVVYFLDRYLEHAKTVDIRHILISPDEVADTTEDGEELSEEEKTQAENAAKDAAKAKAEEIYKEWQDGDATEDSFAVLAETYSTDTGSSTNGGLYEAVKDGDMVTSFNDWIFDASRKAGDTDIVETDYGYHIIYFVDDNAEEWHVNIESTLLSNKMDDYLSSLIADLEVTDKKGNIAYLHETEAETETIVETMEATAESESETE